MDTLDDHRIAVLAASADVADWTDRLQADVRARGALTTSVEDANLVLVVIGPDGVRDGGALPDALSGGAVVVPLLVDGAEMPHPDRLPASIRDLAFLEAQQVSGRLALSGAVARAIAAGRRFARADPAPSVFVSYRRDDAEHWARVVARALMGTMPPNEVFVDIGSERVGTDYRDQIDRALASCRVLVLLVGPGFLVSGLDGRPRLFDEHDLVRHEIVTALAAGASIQPVLTGGAVVPAADQLPGELGWLATTPALSMRFDGDADTVAARVASLAGFGDAPGPRPGDRLDPGARVLADDRARRQARERYAEHVVRSLADFGWVEAADVRHRRRDRRSTATLVHPEHPGYRLVHDADRSRIRLWERVPTLRRGGLPSWVVRWPIELSPRSPDALGVQQLPADLLDIALDPDAFLDRVGRARPSPQSLDRMMTDDTLLGNVEALGMAAPTTAIELYQRTRRDVAAGGGVDPLTLRHAIDLAVDADAIAVHPTRPTIAVGGDDGVVLCDLVTGEVTRVARHGACRSLAYSATGRLAAGTADGKVDVWGTDGSLLVRRWTPYGRRLPNPWREPDDRSFDTIAWSGDGDRIAVAGGDRVWIWSPDGPASPCSWEFPEGLPRNRTRGAVFLPGSDRLLVFGLFRHLWTLDTATMGLDRTLELIGAPSRPARVHVDPDAFPTIHGVAVDRSGRVLACAGRWGQIALCALPQLQLTRKLAWRAPQVSVERPVDNHVRGIAFSPDGRWLASIADDDRIVIGSTETWQPTHACSLGGVLTRGLLTWLPDSSAVAVVEGHQVQIWSR